MSDVVDSVMIHHNPTCETSPNYDVHVIDFRAQFVRLRKSVTH
jgi:hypothetical protein